MKKFGVLIGIAFLVLLAGCDYFQKSSKEVVVAECYGKYLYASDLQGIVPEGVLPVYCESWFPRNDILDFMNLPFENNSRRAKIIAKAQWYPLEQARLKDADGESR